MLRAEKDVETLYNVIVYCQLVYSQDYMLPHPNPRRVEESRLLIALSKIYSSIVTICLKTRDFF